MSDDSAVLEAMRLHLANVRRECADAMDEHIREHHGDAISGTHTHDAYATLSHMHDDDAAEHAAERAEHAAERAEEAAEEAEEEAEEIEEAAEEEAEEIDDEEQPDEAPEYEEDETSDTAPEYTHPLLRRVGK